MQHFVFELARGFLSSKSDVKVLDFRVKVIPAYNYTKVKTSRVSMEAQRLESVTKKREGYLEWPDYFMAIAFLSAQRSKDPRTQVGACIVNEEKKIVGIGYNGMPNGCSDDIMPWGRTADDILQTKQLYVCHAELNAVLNKNSADVKNCTIYVALFPCNECAKVVIQAGIKEVIYYSDKYHDKPEFIASRKMMDLAGVVYRQYIPKHKQIVIDFSAVDQTVTMVESMNKVSLENTNTDINGDK